MASAAYILCITIFVLLACATQGRTCSFETIYQFGDSIADTGNLIRRGAVGASSNGARLPYGETYFNRPTGRFSDGRIMLDYIGKLTYSLSIVICQKLFLLFMCYNLTLKEQANNIYTCFALMIYSYGFSTPLFKSLFRQGC